VLEFVVAEAEEEETLFQFSNLHSFFIKIRIRRRVRRGGRRGRGSSR
jgi:hypothetical protein